MTALCGLVGGWCGIVILRGMWYGCACACVCVCVHGCVVCVCVCAYMSDSSS